MPEGSPATLNSFHRNRYREGATAHRYYPPPPKQEKRLFICRERHMGAETNGAVKVDEHNPCVIGSYLFPDCLGLYLLHLQVLEHRYQRHWFSLVQSPDGVSQYGLLM